MRTSDCSPRPRGRLGPDRYLQLPDRLLPCDEDESLILRRRISARGSSSGSQRGHGGGGGADRDQGQRPHRPQGDRRPLRGLEAGLPDLARRAGAVLPEAAGRWTLRDDQRPLDRRPLPRTFPYLPLRPAERGDPRPRALGPSPRRCQRAPTRRATSSVRPTSSSATSTSASRPSSPCSTPSSADASRTTSVSRGGRSLLLDPRLRRPLATRSW